MQSLKSIPLHSDSDPDLFAVEAQLIGISKPDTMKRVTFSFALTDAHSLRVIKVARVKYNSTAMFYWLQKIARALNLKDDAAHLRSYKVPQLLNKPLRVQINEAGYVVGVFPPAEPFQWDLLP